MKVCWQRKTGRNRTAATSPLNHIAEAELQFMQAMTSVEIRTKRTGHVIPSRQHSFRRENREGQREGEGGPLRNGANGRITQSAWNFYSRSGGIHNKSALEQQQQQQQSQDRMWYNRSDPLTHGAPGFWLKASKCSHALQQKENIGQKESEELAGCVGHNTKQNTCSLVRLAGPSPMCVTLSTTMNMTAESGVSGGEFLSEGGGWCLSWWLLGTRNAPHVTQIPHAIRDLNSSAGNRKTSGVCKESKWQS